MDIIYVLHMNFTSFLVMGALHLEVDLVGDILGSHGSAYEINCLLGCCNV
jgi:hypothetical protein